MSKIFEYFKPKPKKKENKYIKTSYWYYFFVVIIIILTLSVALLWPEQISALWFEFCLIILQFLHTPIVFQMWWFILIIFLTAWLGWYLFPTLEVLSSDKGFIYYKWHDEGPLLYFNLLGGYQFVIMKSEIKRKGLRWTTLVPVNLTYQGNLIVAQTAKLEVTESLHWKNYAESLVEVLKKYRAELEHRNVELPLDAYLQIEKARHGGEEK